MVGVNSCNSLVYNRTSLVPHSESAIVAWEPLSSSHGAHSRELSAQPASTYSAFLNPGEFNVLCAVHLVLF